MRLLLWSWLSLVAAAFVAAIPWAIAKEGGDWHAFVAAGALVGTPSLLHPLHDWQAFFYLPGFAYAFVWTRALPLGASFVTNALLMAGCAIAAGALAASAYGLRARTAIAFYALWAPVPYAAATIGQNAPFGLLLAQAAIAGLARGSAVLTALPVGVLLYKPTYALPFVVVLAVRRLWRELAIVAACGAGWYLLSVAATGGDWVWPQAWLQLIARFQAGDLAFNGRFAISLTAVLLHAGVPAIPVAALAVALAVWCAGALRRVSAVEAGAAACLAGLALSPHAWAYDAVLALPMIGYVAAALGEAARTRLLFALAVIGSTFLAAPKLGADPLALVTIGGTCVWLWDQGARRIRRSIALESDSNGR